jgi:hypothetical protein
MQAAVWYLFNEFIYPRFFFFFYYYVQLRNKKREREGDRGSNRKFTWKYKKVSFVYYILFFVDGIKMPAQAWIIDIGFFLF